MNLLYYVWIIGKHVSQFCSSNPPKYLKTSAVNWDEVLVLMFACENSKKNVRENHKKNKSMMAFSLFSGKKYQKSI